MLGFQADSSGDKIDKFLIRTEVKKMLFVSFQRNEIEYILFVRRIWRELSQITGVLATRLFKLLSCTAPVILNVLMHLNIKCSGNT